MALILWLFAFASADKVDDAITWMYDNGLTIHNNKTDFNATRWLRRDEAAKFYVNFSKLLGKTTYVKTANQCIFSDINDSRSDLKDIVIESCRLGLFQWSKGKFNPKNQLTNAQAITVLVRLLAGNQGEVWLSHRANNYYTKANELNILQNVSMNSKDSIATRGNVGVIIWNWDNYSNWTATTEKTKPDLVLSSIIINNGRSSPKVGDSKIYANFTIRNLGKAITFSSTNKGVFSCTNNGIEIFKYEIKNGYIKENGSFDIGWVESTNGSNIDLFPAPEPNYRLDCSILLSSNNEYPIDENNYKTITFAVLANNSSDNNWISTPDTVVASDFDEINAISSESFMAWINSFLNSPLWYVVKKNWKYWYVNWQKKLIINTEYDNISVYSIRWSNVILIVKKQRSWWNTYDYNMWLINSNWEILLPVENSWIYQNRAGLYLSNYVTFGKNWFCWLIDDFWNIILPATKYNEIKTIEDDYQKTVDKNIFLVAINNKRWLIDKNMNTIIPLQYDNYNILWIKLIALRLWHKRWLYKTNWIEVLPPEYDNITRAYNNQTNSYYILIREFFDSWNDQKMDFDGNWIN